MSDDIQNEMTYVELNYGGGGDNESNISLLDVSRLALTNSTVSNSAGYGLFVEEPDASTNSLEGFASNTFESNAQAPVSIPVPVASAIDGASSFSGNDAAYVLVRDGRFVGESATLSKLADGVPYRISGQLEIESQRGPESLLTIEPGVRLEFEQNGSLYVDGDFAALVAQGTASEPIILTGTEHQPGWWKGVSFGSENQHGGVFQRT